MRQTNPVQCPACGFFLVETERVAYSGKNDCRITPVLFCPECGWKRHSSSAEGDFG